jgi:hypothetical protein
VTTNKILERMFAFEKNVGLEIIIMEEYRTYNKEAIKPWTLCFQDILSKYE